MTIATSSDNTVASTYSFVMQGTLSHPHTRELSRRGSADELLNPSTTYSALKTISCKSNRAGFNGFAMNLDWTSLEGWLGASAAGSATVASLGFPPAIDFMGDSQEIHEPGRHEVDQVINALWSHIETW